jgi:hypothetical protein
MYKRILVPLDGWASARAVLPCIQSLAKVIRAELDFLRVLVNPVLKNSYSGSSIASCLVNELEAETKIYLKPGGMRRHKNSFLTGESSRTEAILAVADAMEVNRAKRSRTAVAVYSAESWEASSDCMTLPYPVRLLRSR